MPKRLEIAGKRFGRLVVVEFLYMNSIGKSVWRCVCSCGSVREVVGAGLVSGNTTSCGCYQKDRILEVHTTHGLSNSCEYKNWQQMIGRCTNTNNASFSDYGGRGITVCESWFKFEQFYADMGPRPSPDHSIDRMANDGPYCKDNCRWATPKEQANNKRNNRRVEFDGRTMSLTDWAKETGLPYNALRRRLSRGWSIEDALTIPANKRRMHRCAK